MEVGFQTIGNATLICHDRGRPVLVTDPWVRGGAYFGSWKLSHEVPEEQMEAVRNAEFVWFSHGHPDHLNGDSLELFRGRKILLPNHFGGRIHDDLVSRGFHVQVLCDREWTELSPKIRILCIADYNQDAILLVDIAGQLVVNLNDASDRGWGPFVRRTIRRYRSSFLMALHGFGDADMLNYFDESGARMPLPPRGALGQTIAQQCEYYGARYFIPFSSMHRYQRTDSAWAAPVAAALEDYRRGFRSTRCELLPAFTRFDCERDRHDLIDPPATPERLFPPEHFGDNWAERLESAEVDKIRAYFGRIQRLGRTLSFIKVRVGGVEHTIDFKKADFEGGARSRGLTFEAPRHSLMTAIDYQIFDDLLIGNFMKVTLHGDFGPRHLYPDVTPYIAKYGDNGQAHSEGELARYFAEYRRRDPLGHLRHQAERRVLFPLQSASAGLIRNRLGPDSPLYRAVKRTYWFLRGAL